jgi:RNA polymerase sigma factor (sigma-70 family)
MCFVKWMANVRNRSLGEAAPLLRPLHESRRRVCYIYRVALNVAADWRERACYRLPHDADDALEEMESSAAHPESTMEQADSDRRVQRPIDRLRPRSRDVLRLTTYEELSYAEVADRVACRFGW